MQNKNSKKLYRNITRKILIRTVIIFFMSVFIVVKIRSVGRGVIGNKITYIISKIFHVEQSKAINIYFYYIRQYYDIIILIAIVLVFAVLYKVFLSCFTRYFDELIAGVNRLADRKGEIKLSPELSFMEDTMNKIKNDLIQSEEEKRAQEKRKNELILYLAHDIKTPLTSVIGYLSLLDENPELPKEKKCEYVHITMEKADVLEKLINEFFEIARYNLNTVPLNIERIDVGFMIQQMIDEAYPILQSTGKNVNVRVTGDCTIEADSEKIARVFHNVFKNAIAYSDEKSEINIQAFQDNNEVRIITSNEGSISAEQLETMFDKFHRLNHSADTKTAGAGLGLAIAKDIISIHKGKIYAENINHQIRIITVLPCKHNDQYKSL